jgi:Protein of unknown function (DUF3465)
MGSIIRVFARLLQLIAAVLRRRGQRRQAQKPKAAKRGSAAQTAHQQRSQPKGGPNRRARRQQQRQHADEVFGLASGVALPKHVAPDPPPADPPLAVSKEELDTRQRTTPFKVADMSQLAPTATNAFEHKYNNVMLTVQGRVTKRLSTDTIGAHHQRFIITLPDGQSVLVVHNIDDAPRVPLRVSDELEVRGRYLWNEQGGEMHWTHHDPLGKLAGGYIEMLNTRQKYD